jgi:hypothetical protein
MTYTELQADIASYLHRTDLAALIPTFIEKARQRINRQLRVPEQEVTATLTTPVLQRFSLPANFIELRGITSAGVPLRSVGLHEMSYYARLSSAQVYALYGHSVWIPGATTVDITYFAAEPELTVGSQEWETMAQYPQLWVNGALAEAGFWLQNWELMDRATLQFNADVVEFNARAERARSGTAPAQINSDAYSTFAESVN